jgi:glycosyltransferase involved in cell wall biosynthesis
MRVLYLCPSPYLGVRDRAGWSTHMSAVINGLRDHGHAVTPFLAASHRAPARPGHRTARASTSPLRRLVPAPIRLARRDLFELLHDRGLDHRVMQACRRAGAEVIYERTEVYHGVGARVARRLGLPLVVEVNGPLVEEREAWAGMLFPGAARRIEARKYAAADAVVTVSSALADYLCAHGVDRGKIHAIPNGADTTLFDPQRAHGAAIRTTLGLGRRLVIGFVGAFADWHGLETLVRAVGEICRSRALDVHLVMLGEGPQRPALRELARQAGLEGRVSLFGSVSHDQVPHYLAATDICVLPGANWYMSPIKLFEYGAMGKAVIAPRTPAVAEVMTDGEDGLLVEPGRLDELERALRRLANHPQERRRLAANFQQRVREHHSWMTVAGRVSQLLEQSVRARQDSLAAPELSGMRREA